jgi:hypothetical protein
MIADYLIENICNQLKFKIVKKHQYEEQKTTY